MYCPPAQPTSPPHPDLSATISATIPPNRPKKLPRDWSVKELHEAMHAALLASPHPVYIFLDEMDQSQELDDVLDLLEGHINVPQLSVCIASRPEPAIGLRLSKYPALCLQDPQAWRH
jgi:hypothetical protein